MKKIILLLAFILVAIPCYAGIPSLPFDGNGNMYPVMWNGTDWVFVSDSVAIGSAFGSTDSMPVKGSVYVITSNGAPLYVREVNNDTKAYIVNQDTHVTITSITDTASVKLYYMYNSTWTPVTSSVEGLNVSIAAQAENLYVVNMPNSMTDIVCDTAIAASTWDTFVLDDDYTTIYVTSDTDIIVALHDSEVNEGCGEMLYAGVTGVWHFSTQYVYIRTKSGLEVSGAWISVRGMKQ